MDNSRRDFIKKTALAKVTFDEKTQEVLAGGKIFKY